MSGHRWSSLLAFWTILALIGCQSDEPRKRVWNPFRKATAQTEEAKEDSPFSLPGFPRKNSDETNAATANADLNAPVAEEQVERLLADGQLALQEERLEDARNAYTQVLTFSPDNATAHHGLAMAADLTQQWADAEYHYRQALRIRPRDANLLCDIGYSYLLQNRYSEASRYLNHAVEINPQHESAQMNLALLDLKQGNRSAAQNRITARFGVSAEAAQVMAQLDSQTGVDSASFKTEAGTGSLANASFEQVQELARQERIEAERRRASQGMPSASTGGLGDPQKVAVLSNQTPPGSGNFYGQSQTSPPGSAFPANPGNMSAPPASGLALSQPAGLISPNQAQPSATNPAFPGNLPNSAQPNYSNLPISIYPPGVGVANNSQVGPASAAGTGMASHLSQPPAVNPQPPFDANSQTLNSMAPASQGAVNSASMPYSAPPQSPTNLSSSSRPVDPTLSASNSSAAPNSSAPAAGTNRIIPVHSTGTFQTANVGSVSYGQPLGFQSGSAGTGSTSPMNNSSSASVSAASMGPGSSPGSGASPNFNPSVPNASQPIYLDGLNAGPGTMFPIGQSAPQQPGVASNPSINPMPQVNMNNVSSPGSNSMLNGAFYAQPDSSLPAQEWANQQQQQLRAQQLQSQQWQNQQRQGMPTAPPSTPVNSSGPSPFPARPAPINPLEAYERQRQQLDSEYNKTLQQMDRQNGRTAPAFP